MKATIFFTRPGFVTLLLACLVSASAAEPSQPWTYTLIDGSQIIDDCPICGRPAIPVPARGTFQLLKLEDNPLAERYLVTNLNVTADNPGGTSYRLTGGGTYEIGGEVALRQAMWLQVDLQHDQTNQTVFFEAKDTSVDRRWPMLRISLEQTNGTLTQLFTLDLAAAPFRDLQFSTVHGMTPANLPGVPYITSGDLLSSLGHIVKRNAELTGSSELDFGLDAFDILPDGRFAFSTEVDGSLWAHGDVLGRPGNWGAWNETLISTFGATAPYDLGLDGLQVEAEPGQEENAKYYFSIQTNFVVFRDPGPNLILRAGDLLLSDLGTQTGQIWKRNLDLLARFQPADTNVDYGLDSFFIWPGGEVWFSTETGFQDRQLGAVLPGDLLSDFGYVVFRNLDLTGPFGPIEDLADFGLDALAIITDLRAAPEAGRLTRISADTTRHSIRFEWQPSGRSSQVEAAPTVLGPFSPISPVLSDTQFEDVGALTNHVQRFYRVLQW